MIRCTVKGDFKKTRNFLRRSTRLNLESLLKQYAEEGAEALKAATPIVTGKTSESWTYKIEVSRSKVSVDWYNTNENEGVSIAVILEYGHGTGWGGYVQGRHYISPAIQPVFDKITTAIWKEVTRD